MSKDLMIGYFFADKNIQAIADKQLDFLMYVAGMRPDYLGKAPTLAHLQLPPILAGHFDRRITLLQETLTEHHLTDKDIEVWIEFEKAFREAIVQPEGD
jgi:truncated hemoglobin YjbI